jgi:DNA-binding response OmpR family regulator
MQKVIIAEDDLMIADMLEEVLVSNGYEVCGIARTVDSAVALVEQQKPALAVLDLRLAEGGLGTEIAARLNRPNGLGILYATGNGSHIALTKIDGDACLGKPYQPQDIVRALKIVEQIVNNGNALPPFPRGFHVLSGTSKEGTIPGSANAAQIAAQIERPYRQEARASELRENAARCLRLSGSINSPGDVAALEAMAAQATEEAEQMEAVEAVRFGERQSDCRMTGPLANRDAEPSIDITVDRRRPGRQDDVIPMLIPLMRRDPLERLFVEPTDREPDQHVAFVGIFIWGLMSAAVWAPLLWWVL